MPCPPPSTHLAFHHKILSNTEIPQSATVSPCSVLFSTSAPSPFALCASIHASLPSPISDKTLRPPQADSDPPHILPQPDSTGSRTSPLHYPSTLDLQLALSHAYQSIWSDPSHGLSPNRQAVPPVPSFHFPGFLFRT